MQIDAKRSFPALRSFAAELFADNSGLAMVEFAVSLPFFLGLAIAGLETANYAATNMRINQIAVHIADNAARMGDDVLAGGQQVSEIDINDVFTGARHEGNALVFDGFHPYTDPGNNQVVSRGNARIFLSSIEPVANPNPTNKYKIGWQRCSGPGTHYRPVYGSPAATSNVDGVGPTGRQTIAPPFGATMFAEIHYHFEPIIDLGYSKLTSRDIVATAAMVVRDSRDYSAVFNAESVTASTCNFS
ncbi:MAG: pilus assembly protein [Sphingorhabdus sp.]